SARRIELRFSGDAFGEPLFVDVDVSSFPDALSVHTIDLTDLGLLSGSFEFRFYGYGALSTNGVLGFANSPEITANDLPGAVKLTGEVTLIPEPALTAVLLVIAALAATRLRRRSDRSV